MDNLHERYEYLKKEINYHNYLYHVLDAPIISDAQFDRLLREIRDIEQNYPDWIQNDSPTQRAGSSVSSKFQKIKHVKPILSLANAFNAEEIKAWYERILKLNPAVEESGFVVEPKIDGLTVVLTYSNGLLVQAATRGDGLIGEDITANIRTVRSVPLYIPVEVNSEPVPELLVVRAEAFINRKDFDVLNKINQERGERIYLNPRNTAAGALRQLDPKLTASRPITILAYAIVDGMILKTQWETLAMLKKWGFPVTNNANYYKAINELLSASEAWNEQRQVLPFETDGVVIKLDNLEVSESLGTVGKDPRGAIALKFPAREITTKLLDIGVNVGRTGVLTPFAILEPVELGGVTIKQATLHNFDFIKEKDIRIGDTVLIKRAGDVIPYVMASVADARISPLAEYEPPKLCPICQQEVENIPGEVALYCVNSTCPAQVIRNIEHFVSKSAMDVEGMGSKVAELLVNKGLLYDASDIYYLKKTDLLNIEGFADKKAENIIQAIQASKNQPLSRLIFALGIHGIGEVAANDLAKAFKNLDAISVATSQEIQRIEGIGPNTSESVINWFSKKKNQQLLVKLKQAGIWPIEDESEQKISGIFMGLSFVITGTLDTFTREGVKIFIEDRGGKVSESISKKTNFLVLGKDAGSKLEKAKSLGITIIKESDLRAMAEK